MLKVTRERLLFGTNIPYAELEVSTHTRAVTHQLGKHIEKQSITNVSYQQFANCVV